jgi:hypothetical protein
VTTSGFNSFPSVQGVIRPSRAEIDKYTTEDSPTAVRNFPAQLPRLAGGGEDTGRLISPSLPIVYDLIVRMIEW